MPKRFLVVVNDGTCEKPEGPFEDDGRRNRRARHLFQKIDDTLVLLFDVYDDDVVHMEAFTHEDAYPDTDERTPEACPICGCTNIRQAVNEWHATCIDDPENDAVLTEHQCEDCGVSFWL